MEKTFKTRIDRRSKMLTPVYMLVLAGICAALYGLYEGEYLSVWFLVTALGVVALALLSVPRRVRIGEDTVEIHCVMELTEIPLADIASVRRIDRSALHGVFPLFGVWGFFGYYGIFFDRRTLDRLRIYAGEWDRFVEIVREDERRYVVSVTDPDGLVREIRSARSEYLARDGEPTPA